MQVPMGPVLVVHLLDDAQQAVEHAERKRSHKVWFLLPERVHVLIDDVIHCHSCHITTKVKAVRLQEYFFNFYDGGNSGVYMCMFACACVF